MTCAICNVPLPKRRKIYCSTACKYEGLKQPLKTVEQLRAELEANSIPIPFCGCVVWLGAINDKGYGTIRLVGASSGGKFKDYVHRVAYEIDVGPIPDGLQLDHLCRVHGCWNAEHLEPATNRENTIRGDGPRLSRERARVIREATTHCKYGHAWTSENTMQIDSGGRQYRRCRTCHYASRNRSEGRSQPADRQSQPRTPRT